MNDSRMNDLDMVSFLTDAMYEYDADSSVRNMMPPRGDQDDPIPHPEVEEITTFENAELLTHNKGLVVKMEDGSEWQIQILKTR